MAEEIIYLVSKGLKRWKGECNLQRIDNFAVALIDQETVCETVNRNVMLHLVRELLKSSANSMSWKGEVFDVQVDLIIGMCLECARCLACPPQP